MPTFVEGQDPLDQGAPAPGRMPLGPTQPDPFVGPTHGEVIGAAFRQNNPVASVLDAISRGPTVSPPVPGYDPIPRLVGTKYEPLLNQSLGDTSPDETTARMAKFDAEQKDQQTLADAGWGGTVAALAAGALDPSWFIPIAGEARAGAELGIGARILRGAGEGALRSSVSETALMASQVTRTPETAGADIATNTILMGLIGGGTRWLEGGERKGAVDGLEAMRRDLSPPAPAAPPLPSEGVDTRGMGRIFHGTGSNLGEALKSNLSSDAALYGNGFYTTDAFDIAKGYAEKRGKKTGAQDVQEFSEQPGVKLFNIDDPIAANDDLLKSSVMNGTPAQIVAVHNAALDKLGERGAERPALMTMEQRADDIRRSGLTTAEAVAAMRKSGDEFFQNDFFAPLQEQGFDGLRHTGGAITGKAAHEVKIYWNPDRDLTRSGTAPELASDLSAASSDKRTMVLSPILPPIVRDAIAAIPGGDAALNAMRQIGLAASPSGRTFLNGSLPGARAMGDLAETSLKFTQAAEGQTASTLGTVPISRISRMQQMRFEQVNRDALEDAFTQYRGKSGPSILVRAQAAVENLTGNNDGKMNFDEFKKQVYLAQTQGGEHPIPEVAKAARDVTAKVYDPVLKFAQSVKDKDGRPVIAEAIGPPAGDKGFAPRIFNKPAIAEDPNGFDQKNLEWLTGEQAKKAEIRERIGRIHYNLINSEDLAESLEGRIERRTGALEIVQNKAEEVRRLNEFAYKRSEKLSKPLDELREKIRGITDKISPSLDRLSKLAEDIKTEKANFPEIKDADARIFKLIGAAQKLKQSRDIVDTIDNATEFADTIDDVIGGAKDQIREASAHAKDVRLTSGADDLLALERERTNVRKEVAPYLKQLNRSRRDLRGLEEARTPGARGGSVFETKIRDRGNALADQASGRAHEIDAMADRLAQERKAQTELRAELEGELGKWEGKTTDEVNSALKARAEAEAARKEKMAAGTYQGSGERLTGADSVVDRAVKRVLGSKQDLSQDELMSLAREIRNRINTAPDGRLPYDAPSGGENLGASQPLRGSLNGRDYAIPTANILKYVHTDMEHVVPAYLRTIIPDLHLMKRFGDVEMSEQFKKVNEWYDGLAAKETDAKKLMKIDASRKAEVRDLAATRDRIRGVYGMPTNQTQRNFGRVARAVGNWNVGTFLGTSMLNRFQDMANATARRGLLGYMGDGFLPFIKGASRIDAGSAASRQFMKDIGVGVDTVSGHSASLFWDVVNNHLPGNRFERGLRASANTAMIVTGHTPWTDMNKQIAGMAASAEFLRMAERIAEGAHTERDIRSMAHAGIDPAMARRISKSFNDGGFTQVGDAKVPNTADWKDAGAREAFEAAIQKDADIAVITPGAEKPLFLSDPTMALLGQFKGFAFAAQERILISNLQEADGRTLQGLLHMLGMGALSYAAYSLATGQAMSNRPQDWVKEAVTRAGMMGWMSDVNAMQAKFTGGKTDAWRGIGADRPLTRHTSQSALEEMLGPTFALLNGVAQAGTDASFGAWSAKDTHKLRQAMFLQNHFLIRKLLDQAEAGFDEHLGLKPPVHDPSLWTGAPPKQ